MKALIPAAGLGTRFLPVTKVVPKEMLPIGNRPALDLIVEEAKSAGAEEVIIIISHGKELIRQYFKDDPSVRFVYQEEQRGLGHAVLQAAEAVGDVDRVLILLGDAVVIGCNAAKGMAEVSAANGNASVIGLERVPKEKVSRYGIVKPAGGRTGETPVPQGDAVEGRTGKMPVPQGDDAFCGTGVSPVQIEDLIEKPSPEEAPSDLAVAGRYLLDAKIFDLLRTQTPGKNNEIQLTDAIRRMIGGGGARRAALPTTNNQSIGQSNTLFGYVYPGKRQDIGNPDGYFKALEAFRSCKS